jgi:hypothetical protein
MAMTAKRMLDTALGYGKAAVSAAERRLRGGDRTTDTPPSTPGTPAAKTSGGPTTVGAAEPGKPGAPKSATAPTARATERPPAGRAKAPAAKPAKRRSTAAATKRRATGSAGSGAAKRPPKAKRGATPKAAVKPGKAAEPEADKLSTPRKRPGNRRTTASDAAATRGPEVADAPSDKKE